MRRASLGLLAAAAALAAMAAGSGATAAATVTFDYPSGACPQGPTGLTDCIDNASDGDTISVKPGLYYENVVVNNAVTVKGTKCDKVIIDAAPPAPPGFGVKGVGFQIADSMVTIECLTIRHATSGVDSDGFDDLTVRRVIMNDVSNGVRADAGTDRLRVENSRFQAGDSRAIRHDGGATATIVGNTILNRGEDCINLFEVSNARVQNNVITTCDDGSAVELNTSNNSVVRDNRGTNSDNDTFRVSNSANVIVAGNVANGSTESAFEIVSSPDVQLTKNTAMGHHENQAYLVTDSDNAIVAGNRVENGAGDEGFQVAGGNNRQVTGNVALGTFDNEFFDIDCLGGDPCDNVLVRGNKGMGAPDDDDGFFIRVVPTAPCAAFPCVRILDNMSMHAAEDGFFIVVDDALIRGNLSTEHGESDSDQGHGFNLAINRTVLERNTASWNAVHGFNVNGNDNTLDRNKAFRNSIDGIQVNGGDDNTLNMNLADNNLGDGIENDGTNTILTNNVSMNNRADCVSDGTIATNTGNMCADGSNFAFGGTLDP
jgi:parallel beta-helix repeat protein